MPLRVSTIAFLNPAPLLYNFEHEPTATALREHYDVHYTSPAICAAELNSGTADLGLIPIASLTPKLAIVPGCAIASRDEVRSILLLVKNPDWLAPNEALQRVRTVATDTASRSSVTYTRILFEHFHQTSPDFVDFPADLATMLPGSDAALLIGDPALLALEDRHARERRTGERLLYLDLAHEWHTFTGTVWVSAVWAVRPDAIASSSIPATQVVEDFQHSRDAGLAHIDALADEWSTRIAVPRATIRTYLSENIWYILDQPCLEGLDLFFRYAAECGILPAAPPLRFL